MMYLAYHSEVVYIQPEVMLVDLCRIRYTNLVMQRVLLRLDREAVDQGSAVRAQRAFTW